MEFTSPENAGAAPAMDVREISRDEIKRRLDDPTLLLIDVLPHEAYAVEHIPGATNLPLAELETRALAGAARSQRRHRRLLRQIH